MWLTGVQTMCSYVTGKTPQFLMFRTILEYPTFMQQVQQVPTSHHIASHCITLHHCSNWPRRALVW